MNHAREGGVIIDDDTSLALVRVASRLNITNVWRLLTTDVTIKKGPFKDTLKGPFKGRLGISKGKMLTFLWQMCSIKSNLNVLQFEQPLKL